MVKRIGVVSACRRALGRTSQPASMRPCSSQRTALKVLLSPQQARVLTSAPDQRRHAWQLLSLSFVLRRSASFTSRAVVRMPPAVPFGHYWRLLAFKACIVTCMVPRVFLAVGGSRPAQRAGHLRRTPRPYTRWGPDPLVAPGGRVGSNS